MRTRTVLALFLVLTVLSGCSLLRRKSSPATTGSASKLVEAIEQGKTYRCMLTKKDGTLMTEYTMKGAKLRAVSSTPKTTSTKSYILIDDATMYIWKDGDSTGLKSTLPSMAHRNDLISSLDSNQNEEEQKDFTVECSEVSIEDSEFAPPSQIQFADTSEFIQKSDEAASPSQP